jgi:hypothetical protein
LNDAEHGRNAPCGDNAGERPGSRMDTKTIYKVLLQVAWIGPILVLKPFASPSPQR